MVQARPIYLNNYMIRNKVIITIIASLCILQLGFFVPQTQAANLADQIKGQTQAGATKAGFGNAKDPRIIVAQVVQLSLGLVGSVFLVLFALSSYWYITARGREDRVEKATGTIKRSIIGLIIIIAAYSITYFVTQKVQEAVKSTPERYNSPLEDEIN